MDRASRDQPRSPGRAHPGRGRRSAAVSTGDRCIHRCL